MQLEAEQMADIVTRAMDVATAPLFARIVALEARIGALGSGSPGPPGPVGPPGSVGARGMDGAVGRDGRDGKDGIDGKDGAPGAMGPEGRIGPKGADGSAGRDGLDGKSVTVEDLRSLVAELVAKAVSAIPIPKDGAPGRDGIDGKDGLPGRDGRDGLPGLAGEKGLDGKPGLDGQPGLNGKDGAPGRDGTLEDAEFVQGEDVRCGTWRSKSTGRTLGLLTFPVPIYRGVFEHGKTYAACDRVTHQGSEWHARAETNEVPGEGATAWVLCAKRGRDGKPGKDGGPGPEGKPGRDLTQMDFDGKKW